MVRLQSQMKRWRWVEMLRVGVFGVVLCLSCHPEVGRFRESISDLNHGSLAEQRAAIWRLYGEGKTAIPELIDAIDSETGSACYFRWFGTETIIFPSPWESRPGASAAYVIEMILGLDSLEDPGPIIDSTSPLLGSSPANYVYAHGILRRGTDTRGLTEADMKKVKAAYQKWWKANKHRSLTALREDAREGRGPLRSSEYGWW